MQVEYNSAAPDKSHALPTKRSWKSHTLTPKITRKSRNDTAMYGRALPARMSERLAGEQ